MIDVLLQMLIGFVSCFTLGRGNLPKYIFHIVDKLKDGRYPLSFEKECGVQKIKQGKKHNAFEPRNK